MKISVMFWPYTAKNLSGISNAVLAKIMMKDLSLVRSDITWTVFVPHNKGPIINDGLFDDIPNITEVQVKDYGSNIPITEYNGYMGMDLPFFNPETMKWMTSDDASEHVAMVSFFSHAQALIYLQSEHDCLKTIPLDLRKSCPGIVNMLTTSGNIVISTMANTRIGRMLAALGSYASDVDVVLNNHDKIWLDVVRKQSLSMYARKELFNTSIELITSGPSSEDIMLVERPENRVTFFHGGSFVSARHIPFCTQCVIDSLLVNSNAKLLLLSPAQKRPKRLEDMRIAYPEVITMKNEVRRSEYIESLVHGDFVLMNITHSGTALAYNEAILSGMVPIIRNYPWTIRQYDYFPFYAKSDDEFRNMILFCASNPVKAKAMSFDAIQKFRMINKRSVRAARWNSILETAFIGYQNRVRNSISPLWLDVLTKVIDSMEDEFGLNEFYDKCLSIVKSPDFFVRAFKLYPGRLVGVLFGLKLADKLPNGRLRKM